MSEPALDRRLGLRDIVLFGVGGIVGAGIYAIIGEAAAYGGSLLWVSFLLAAGVAFLTAVTYAELVSRYPDAGGSFEYVRQAFGIRTAAVSSIAMLFTGIVAAGAIGIAFSSYLSRLLDLPTIVTTVAVIVLMGVVSGIGAGEASWFNTFATTVTLLGLAAVVVVSVGDVGSVDLLAADDGVDLVSLGVGGALIFFSFIGFEDLVKLAEETREPSTNLPKGILISAGIVVVVYLLVAVAAVSALGPDQLAESSGPLAAIMEAKVGAIGGAVMAIVALFATSKTILSNLLGASRLAFDVARDTGLSWLERLARVRESTGTPVAAVIAVTVLAAGVGAIGDLRVVAAIANVLIMIVFMTVNVALLKIRHDADEPPPFRVRFSIAGYPIAAMLAILGVATLLVLNLVALFGAGPGS